MVEASIPELYRDMKEFFDFSFSIDKIIEIHKNLIGKDFDKENRLYIDPIQTYLNPM